MNETMSNFLRFEDFVGRAFEALGYEIQRNVIIEMSGSDNPNITIDYIATKSGKSEIIEVKFYTANSRAIRLISGAFLHVHKAISRSANNTGIIVANANLRTERITNLREQYDNCIQYWSIRDLANKLVNHPKLYEEALFYDFQAPPQPNTSSSTLEKPSIVDTKQQDQIRDDKIDTLIEELNNCPVSKGPPFERICEKILRFVFEDQLTAWGNQERSDDGLHIRDLIARVINVGNTGATSTGTNTFQEDFWSIVSRHFNCRYITFEFKNYKKPINQGEVLTTEKYLYLKALRSVAIIIARNGAHPNAIQTMKGALRENGKLILCISTQDLEKMLLKVKVGDDAQQVLIEKLDKHLLTINR